MISTLRKIRSDNSGQALAEFALAALLMIMLIFGLIDFSRAIYEKQVMTHLTREGSNLASRGTDLGTTANAVVQGSAPLNLTQNGRVIVTTIYNDGSGCRIKGQVSQGGLTASSKFGNTVGSATACVSANIQMPPPNQTLFATEVFYTYKPVTPVGKMLPQTLYDVAYF